MDYRELGDTGLRVSEVGLGCGPLGIDANADYTQLLTRALDLGVNFFDSADFYSGYRSEEWLGRVLAGRRDDVIIATKFGTIPGKGKDFSVGHMRRSLEESLGRLKTDYIDVYQLHSPPPAVLEDDELLAALQEAKAQGKIRCYGMSLEGGDYGMEAIRRWHVDSIQITFNLFHQDPAEEFLDFAEQNGVGVIVKSPLDSGILGGDLSPGSPRKLDDARERWGEEETARRQRFSEEVEFLAEETGRTWSQAALQFALSFDAVSTVIPGTTSVKHLDENAAAAGGRLTEDELARIAGLMDGEFKSLNLDW